MNDMTDRLEQVATLRRHAEDIRREQAALTPEQFASLSSEEMLLALHELRVHQIELETRNENLRRAQGELETVRARYFDLYDLAPVSYFTVSEKGMIEEANLTASILLGVPRGELTRQPFTRFIHKDDQDLHYPRYKQLFETGEPREYEQRMVSSDGRTFWGHVTATVARSDSGAAVCRMVVNDVTIRKETDIWLTALKERTPVGILVTNHHRVILDCNRSCREQFGYDIEELIGQDTRIIHASEESRREFGEQYLPLIRSGQLVRGECRLRRKNGEVFWASIAGQSLKPDEPLREIIWEFWDITARKEAEATTLKLLSLQRATLEATADGVLVVDRSGRWTTFNKKFLDLWRIPPDVATDNDEMIIMTYALPRLAEPEAFLAKVKELYNQPAATSLDSFAFKDGRIFERYSQPQFLEDAIVGRVWSFRDVTERVTAARELDVVREAAEAANRAKSAFLANMSHEIRTPMSAIIGLADLILETKLTPLQRDYLEKITDSSRLLLGILNDILDISKVEAGKLKLESVVFSPLASLEKVAGIITVQARAKGLEFNTVVGPDVPQVVVGDPLRLEQVLINLLGNAVKFTDQGSVGLVITPVETVAARVVLEFRISDTGIGLSPEQCASIFTPFTQGESSTTRHYGGTGLGLSICQRLVTLMGGNITVEGAPGRGSTFRFTACFLPAAVEDPPVAPAPARSDLSVISDARVLLVEDQPIIQEIARIQLLQAGLQVTVATNGREAVDLVGHAAEPFDLVLMDIQMPEMDGYEATRRLRELWRPEELPIIAMTAHALPEEQRKCLATGMNDHVAKPIDGAALHEILCRWIKPRLGLSETPGGNNSTATPGADFPDLPGIRTGEGLAHLGGNPAVYLSLLQQFARENREVVVRLSSLLNDGNFAACRLVAHSLKGVASYLGIMGVAATAGNLETVFIEEDVVAAHRWLEALIGQVAQALASVTELEQSRPVAWSQFTGQQDNLREEVIQEGNGGSP